MEDRQGVALDLLVQLDPAALDPGTGAVRKFDDQQLLYDGAWVANAFQAVVLLHYDHVRVLPLLRPGDQALQGNFLASEETGGALVEQKFEFEQEVFQFAA